MKLPLATLEIDSFTANYHPGQDLTGRFAFAGGPAWGTRAAELSVLWYTAGQGDEDFGIHYFKRWVDESGRALDLREFQRFASTLPPSPLSYDGHIVKVCWCVRLRLFPQQGAELVQEVPFRLGDVPAAVEIRP